MKILFYVEPWIEKSRPEWKTIWLKNVLIPMAESLVKYNPNVDFSFLFLIGDAQSSRIEQIRNIGNARVEVITQRELKTVSPNYLDATTKQHLDSFTGVQMDRMVGICQKYLGKFKPDLIFTFMSQVPFLKKIFPNTLILHQEVGIISRDPYPTTYFLDPFGTFSYGYIGKFKKELQELGLNDEKKKFLEEFRKIFIDEAIKEHQFFSREELCGNNKFKFLVLLPLQIDPYFSFNAYVDFQDQFDYLCYVLDRIDKNIGVVITTHSDWADYLKKDGFLEYVKKTYPNAILSDRFNDISYSSQYLMDLVDGIITISSTLGVQSLIFKKPLFVVGNNSQLTNFCESNNIADIGKILSKNKFKDQDAILYHLLTHYYFLNEPYINNGKWLYQFFTKSIEKYKANCQFDFFDKIDDNETLLKYFRKYRRKPTLSSNNNKTAIIIDKQNNTYMVRQFKKTLKYKISKLLKTNGYKKFKKIEKHLRNL